MILPNLLPPLSMRGVPNCTFFVKQNYSTGVTNALGNRVIDSAELEVSGYAIRESNPQLLNTIGASVDEVPIKVWIQQVTPVNFAAFNNIRCELTLGGVKQSGIFRPVPLGHPFVPSSLQFMIGAFKGRVS